MGILGLGGRVLGRTARAGTDFAKGVKTGFKGADDIAEEAVAAAPGGPGVLRRGASWSGDMAMKGVDKIVGGAAASSPAGGVVDRTLRLGTGDVNKYTNPVRRFVAGGAPVEGASKLARGAAAIRNLGVAGAATAAGKGAWEGFNTPTSEYADRFGATFYDPTDTSTTGAVKDTLLRFGGVASDVGRNIIDAGRSVVGLGPSEMTRNIENARMDQASLDAPITLAEVNAQRAANGQAPMTSLRQGVEQRQAQAPQTSDPTREANNAFAKENGVLFDSNGNPINARGEQLPSARTGATVQAAGQGGEGPSMRSLVGDLVRNSAATMEAARSNVAQHSNGLSQALTPERLQTMINGAQGDITGFSRFAALGELLPQRMALAAAKRQMKDMGAVTNQNLATGLKLAEMDSEERRSLASAQGQMMTQLRQQEKDRLGANKDAVKEIKDGLTAFRTGKDGKSEVDPALTQAAQVQATEALVNRADELRTQARQRILAARAAGKQPSKQDVAALSTSPGDVAAREGMEMIAPTLRSAEMMGVANEQGANRWFGGSTSSRLPDRWVRREPSFKDDVWDPNGLGFTSWVGAELPFVGGQVVQPYYRGQDASGNPIMIPGQTAPGSAFRTNGQVDMSKFGLAQTEDQMLQDAASEGYSVPSLRAKRKENK